MEFQYGFYKCFQSFESFHIIFWSPLTMVNLLHDAQRTVNDAIQPLIKECSVHSVVIADIKGDFLMEPGL